MISKEEQIRAVLSWNTFQWAASLLAPDETMDDKTYRDFITVTPEEMEEYVIHYGFPRGAVCDKTVGPPFDPEDRICIETIHNQWNVYYFKRGHSSDLTQHSSFEEARREVIDRLMTGAKIALNQRYRHAHPEQNLPSTSEMD